MQFVVCYVIGLSCLYSLVISISVDRKLQETKHEKASAAANHLLKELANEQIKSDTDDEDHIEQYDTIDDKSSSETMEFDGFLPVYDSESATDYAVASESDEDSIPMRQAPVMDDMIMKAENH